MKTLYATDLDGTVLGTDGRLSAEAATLWRRLVEAGVMLTYITARTPATVEPIMEAARPGLPGVVMTGAALWHPLRQQYLRVAYHRADDTATIADICRRHGVTPFVYTMAPGTNSLTVYHEAPALTEVEDRFVADRTLNALKSFRLHTPAPADTAACTVLFFAMGDPDGIRRVAEEISASTDCYASWYPDTYHPGLSLLEVFAHGVSKAEGLLEIKRRLGADRVVAFGDNLNDIPMLRAADTSVAVDNAHPEVKAVADLVIGPNTADAVLHYIARQEGLVKGLRP